MHYDLEASQQPNLPMHADVCIVGGGIAGILLADRLAATGKQILVLEAGGFNLEERSQSLYSAEMAATHHTGTTEGRFRIFGGSSTRWGGQLLPYTPDVLQPPASTGLPHWPITVEELAPYYAQLPSLLGADHLPFDASLLTALGHADVPLGNGVRLRYSKWLPFSRRNLAKTLGSRLLTLPNVHVVTHANAARLVHEGGSITAVEALNYRREAVHFIADHFAVTLGTIESSRLILLSGLGGDATGRYFHDHISAHVAELRGETKRVYLRRLGPFFVDGTLHTCKLEATAATRQQHGLLCAMGHIVIQEPEDSGTAAVRNLLRSLQRRQFGEALLKNLVPMLRGIGDVLRLLWAGKFQKRRAVSARARVLLNIDLEQAPNADNRIQLSSNADALGLPRAVVAWRIGDQEHHTVPVFAQALSRALETASLPQPEWFEGVFTDGARTLQFADTFHPMGGLRMGTDAASSVVDARLKVHGIRNLHIASCAVYPTGGSSNPTFTLMALTLRLADELALA